MAEILKTQQSYVEVSRFLKAYNQICDNPTKFINPKTGVNFADKSEFVELAQNEAWLQNTLSHKKNYKILGYDKTDIANTTYFASVLEDVRTINTIGKGEEGKTITEVADYLTENRDVIYKNFHEYQRQQQSKIGELESDQDAKIETSGKSLKEAKRNVRRERRRVGMGIAGRLLLGLAAVAAAPAIIFGAIAMTGGLGALFTMPAFGITATAAVAVYASYRLLAKPFKFLMSRFAKMSERENLKKAKADLLEKEKGMQNDKYKEWSRLKAEEKTSDKDLALLNELNTEAAKYASDHVIPEPVHSKISENIIDGYKHYRDEIRTLDSNLENAFVMQKEDEIIEKIVSDKLQGEVERIRSTAHPTFDIEPAEREKVINEAKEKYRSLKNIDDEYISDEPANENIREQLANIKLEFKYDLDNGEGRQSASIDFDVRKAMSDYAKNEDIKNEAEYNKDRRERLQDIVSGASSSEDAKDFARRIVFNEIGKSVGATSFDVYGYPIVNAKFTKVGDELSYKRSVAKIADIVEHYLYDDVTLEEIKQLVDAQIYQTSFEVNGEKIDVQINLAELVRKQKEILEKEPKDRPVEYQKSTADIKAQYDDMMVKQTGFAKVAINNIIDKSIQEIEQKRGVNFTNEQKQAIVSGERGNLKNYETIAYSVSGLGGEADFAAMKNTNEYFEFSNELRTTRAHVLNNLKSNKYTGSVLDVKNDNKDILTRKEQLMKNALIKYAQSDLGIKDKEDQERFINYVLGSDVTFSSSMEADGEVVIDPSIISKGKEGLTQQDIMAVVNKSLADVKKDVDVAKEQRDEADRLWEEKDKALRNLGTSNNRKSNELILGGALDSSVFINELVSILPRQDENMQEIKASLNITDDKETALSNAIISYLYQNRSRDLKDLNIKPKSLVEILADKGIKCTDEQAAEIIAEAEMFKEAVLDESFERAKSHSKASIAGKNAKVVENTINSALDEIINHSKINSATDITEANILRDAIKQDLGKDSLSLDAKNSETIYNELGADYKYILNYHGLDIKDGKVVEFANDKFGTPEYYKEIILSNDKPQGYAMDDFLKIDGVLGSEIDHRYSRVKKDVVEKQKQISKELKKLDSDVKKEVKTDQKERKEAERKDREEQKAKEKSEVEAQKETLRKAKKEISKISEEFEDDIGREM